MGSARGPGPPASSRSMSQTPSPKTKDRIVVPSCSCADHQAMFIKHLGRCLTLSVCLLNKTSKSLERTGRPYCPHCSTARRLWSQSFESAINKSSIPISALTVTRGMYVAFRSLGSSTCRMVTNLNPTVSWCVRGTGCEWAQ